MPVPHDQRAGGGNSQPAPCWPNASGNIRPEDGGGGGADVVEGDLCSIDSGSRASDGGGLRAPSGCSGGIGDSGGGRRDSGGAGNASADIVEADGGHDDGDEDGQQGSRGSAVATPDLPHRPDDVVTRVTVSITAVDILQRLEEEEPQQLAPRVDTAVNVLVGMARARSS